VVVDAFGAITVAFAIPLNEQRGIYVTRSQDEGVTWSEPVKIFDAAQAGWAMVDNPSLALTDNGHLHLIWTRYSLPTGEGSMGLYYTRSDNGGQSWSTPETVVDKPVIWSSIAAMGERIVHRIWQEASSGRTTLWHEQSQDSGVTWTRIAPVSIFGETLGEPALAEDVAGRLHLLQIVDRGVTGYSLQHWIWDGSNWAEDRNLDLGTSTASDLSNLKAAVAANGSLQVAFVGDAVDAQTGAIQENMFFTGRQMTMPEGQPTPLPPLSPTPPAAATPTVEAQPTPTEMIAAGGDEFQGGLVQGEGNPGNIWIGSIIGLAAAGLIVAVVFIASIRGSNPRKRYR
jgi:hypothetical protein